MIGKRKPYEVYENLTTGTEDETYEDVIILLDGHFAPKINISYKRKRISVLA